MPCLPWGPPSRTLAALAPVPGSKGGRRRDGVVDDAGIGAAAKDADDEGADEANVQVDDGGVSAATEEAGDEGADEADVHVNDEDAGVADVLVGRHDDERSPGGS